jgi:serine/threonine protein phosphatase PrpC
MQGWRLNMEDGHICNPNFDENIGLFAVFDGHGGLECAKFCEKFFEPKLREQPEYQSKKDIGKALEATFLGLDRILMTPRGMELMVQISKEHPN